MRTAIELDAILRICPDLVVETFDDALLVWDEAAAKLHHFDLHASVVWEELDGHSTLDEVAANLAREFGASPGDVATDVLAVARLWAAEGLVAAAT
jgi:hypothetical protein